MTRTVSIVIRPFNARKPASASPIAARPLTIWPGERGQAGLGLVERQQRRRVASVERRDERLVDLLRPLH